MNCFWFTEFGAESLRGRVQVGRWRLFHSRRLNDEILLFESWIDEVGDAETSARIKCAGRHHRPVRQWRHHVPRGKEMERRTRTAIRPGGQQARPQELQTAVTRRP